MKNPLTSVSAIFLNVLKTCIGNDMVHFVTFGHSLKPVDWHQSTKYI